MLKKFKAFCDKPITWGAYFKLCGVALGLSLLTSGAMIAKTLYDYDMLPVCKKHENEQDET